MLTSTSLSRGYFPRRGLLYSILIHELAFIGLLNLPNSNNFLNLTHPPASVAAADPLESEEVMWLPVLRDGGPVPLLPAAIWFPDSGKHVQGCQVYLLYPDSDALASATLLCWSGHVRLTASPPFRT